MYPKALIFWGNIYYQGRRITLAMEGPALRVDSLRFSLPEGSFKSEAKLQMNGVKQLPANPTDRAFWLEHTALSVSASADEALVKIMAVAIVAKQNLTNSQVHMTEAEAQSQAEQQASMMLEMLGQQ